jgi:excisionase family DNA binding protein
MAIEHKLILTTFDAAKLCNANITSIKNWIEKGEIVAFRTPGGHFRIERRALSDFLERHQMPNPLEAPHSSGVLAIHQDASLMERVSLSLGDAFHFVTTHNPVDGLIRIGHMKPRAVLVDASIQGTDPLLICRSVLAAPDLGEIGVLVCEVESQLHEDHFRKAGAHIVVRRGVDEPVLIKALLAALSI